MRPLPALALALLLVGLLPAPARAHDPALHGFNLVTFERPFPAPAFSAQRLRGEQTPLSAFRGRYVLLNFWATWCPPCLEEMPSMDALHRDYRERGLSVVAVSSDKEGAAVVAGFVEKLGVTFPILLDPDGSVATAYGARNLPVTFLLDRDGNVVAAAQGARDWNSSEARSTIAEYLDTP